MAERFTDIKLTPDGFEGTQVANGGTKMRFSAGFALFLIHEAWGDVDFEDEADGYGTGAGTHGDWSGIRDSSDDAINVMLQKTLNHLFPN